MVSFQPIPVQPITPRTPLTAIDPAVLLNSLAGTGIGPSALTSSVPTGSLGASNPAAGLNTLIGSMPFTANPNILNTVNPAQLVNTLAGTGVDGNNPFGGSLPATAAPAPAPGAPPVMINANNGRVQNDQQLLTAIGKIQQNPEGAKLLETALAKGYTIRVGDPAAALNGGAAALDPSATAGTASGTGATAGTASGACPTPGDGCPICMAAAVAAAQNGVSINGLTFSGNRKEIIINPDSPDFDKTLTHELYHAFTDNNGTSQVEEATANIIGDRVSASVNGRAPRDPNQIFRETIPLYPNLPFNNA